MFWEMWQWRLLTKSGLNNFFLSSMWLAIVIVFTLEIPEFTLINHKHFLVKLCKLVKYVKKTF